MNRNHYLKYARSFKDSLLRDVIPFWEQYSIDRINQGYFTCLGRRGEVYDTDKFIWLQGRQAWVFSMLYNKVERKESWLETAKIGIEFLINHGMSKSGNFYFALNAAGDPLVKPYNIFSDCFAAMALSQYAKATQDEHVKILALQVYNNILSRRKNPKGFFDKNTRTRPLKGFALPMILSNLVLELEGVITEEELDHTLDLSIKEVMGTFLDEETGLIYENLSPHGKFVDCFEGRLINPGHGLEAMWFMLDIGERRQDRALINKATNSILSILAFSWDKEYEGIYYFLDIKGYPTQQLEWDQKLWWVHLEALVALSKAFALTGNEKVAYWYHRVHSYTWDHFPDPEHGEWFGYLNRQGYPHLTLKGGKWKGCFHLPRALYQCWQTFEKLANK